MRTTVRLDDDVARAVEALRRERGLGSSDARNELARRGLAMRERDDSSPFRQRTSSLGEPKVPLDDVAEALDLLEGFPSRSRPRRPGTRSRSGWTHPERGSPCPPAATATSSVASSATTA